MMNHEMPKTKNKDGLSYQQRALVEALPTHAWNVSRAAQSVGYSKKYSLAGLPSAIRKNKAWADAVDAKKRQLAQEHAVEAAEVIEGLRKIAHDESASNADRIRAYELLGKTIALFAEKTVTVAEDLKIVLRRPVDAEVVKDEPPEQRPQLRLKHAESPE
jgi:uncharacterized protein (UPF0147 family)